MGGKPIGRHLEQKKGHVKQWKMWDGVKEFKFIKIF